MRELLVPAAPSCPGPPQLEYPKLNELIKFKRELIEKRNHPARYLRADLRDTDLKLLGKFDVIVIDPPWQEYEDRVKELPIYQKHPESFQSWTFEEIAELQINEIGDTPSFLFLWVGTQNLDNGRELFKKWGFKRCEDIVWLKTNKRNKTKSMKKASNSQLLHRVKEHCLVGLKGDVKKASDSHFIHSNIDTDVIVDEEPEIGLTQKPQEIYDIIERFCLGRKRIELFGETHNIRNGWLTIGLNLVQDIQFDLDEYNSWFEGTKSYPEIQNFKGGRYLGTTPEIEANRPKSPGKN